MFVDNNHLIADEGKVLKNGDVLAKEVYLGKYDTVSNWQEVDEPKESEESENPENVGA